ncbi:hypothetical protein ACFVGM_10665 [Kitasatospora purpeofusca]|uniref:hypothetical protein n=1 Tax=Kitasatospora purpeofusca TaxID=67352 RepID=UPI0036962917
MDDLPQGGAGGVPQHHDNHGEERPARSDRADEHPRSRTAATVKAGVPVAEQRSGHDATGERDAGKDPGTTPDDNSEER